MHNRTGTGGALAAAVMLTWGTGTGKAVGDPPAGQAPPLAAAVRYAITDLGTLPGGHYSSARAINNSGQIVGWADTGATHGVLTAHAFLWQNGRMQDIDTLPDAQKAPGTVAYAINNRGDVVGGVEPVSEEGGAFDYIYGDFGWLWSHGQMQEIGSDAVAINDRGQVLIGGFKGSLIWQNGKTRPVPAVPGFQSVVALALNNQGDMAGYCDNGPATAKAFVRLHGETRLLGTLPGQNTSRAIAVNNHGQVLGTTSDEFYRKEGNTTTSGTRSSHAFFWQDGRMTDLGERDVSCLGEQGQVLGIFFPPATQKPWAATAFIWQNGWFTDLNTLVDNVRGWTLENAAAINSRGQIVGDGEHNGQQHAFLLTPTLPMPPAHT